MKMNQSKFGQLVGCSQQNILNFITKGVLEKSEDNKLDVEKSLQKLREFGLLDDKNKLIKSRTPKEEQTTKPAASLPFNPSSASVCCRSASSTRMLWRLTGRKRMALITQLLRKKRSARLPAQSADGYCGQWPRHGAVAMHADGVSFHIQAVHGFNHTFAHQGQHALGNQLLIVQHRTGLATRHQCTLRRVATRSAKLPLRSDRHPAPSQSAVRQPAPSAPSWDQSLSWP